MKYHYLILVTLIVYVTASPSVILPGQSVQTSSFSSSDVTDLHLQSLGISPSRFGNANLFEGARASLTMAVSGLSTPPTGLSTLSLARTPVDIQTTDAASELAQILHGTDEKLRRATIADLLAQTYEGVSLNVAFSMDHEMCELFAVDHSVVEALPSSNNFAFTFDRSSQTFEKFTGNERLELTAEATQAIEWLNKAGVEATVNGAFVRVGAVEFDLRTKADLMFFTELAATAQLLDQVAMNMKDLVEDTVVDSYSFAFTALEEVRRRYGAASAKYRSATKILDAAIGQVEKELEQLYGAVDVQIVLLDDSQTVVPRLDRQLHQLDLNTSTGNYTYTQVAQYQTCLWTGIILFFAILMTFLMTHCMEINKDSILYRSTQSINFN